MAPVITEKAQAEQLTEAQKIEALEAYKESLSDEGTPASSVIDEIRAANGF